MTQFIDSRFEEQIVASQLKVGDRIFASGEQANNHLDMGYEEVPEHLRGKIGKALSDLVLAHSVAPVFLAPVPNGANGWADEIVRHVPAGIIVPQILQFVKLDRRVFEPSYETIAVIEELRTKKTRPVGIVLDDATTDGGTSESMADLVVSLGLDVGLVLSVFYRGEFSTLHSKYERAALVTKHIPTQLDWDAYRAVGSLTSL